MKYRFSKTLMFSLLLLALPFTKAVSDDALASSKGLNPFVAADPQLIVGNFFDYYPIVLGGLGGFRSTIVLACVQDAACTFDLCTIPLNTTNFQCSFNNVYAPREVQFLDARFDFPLNNTGGQVYIFNSPGGNSFGASQQFVFDVQGNGFTFVGPIQGG